jgi:hypothetical protein
MLSHRRRDAPDCPGWRNDDLMRMNEHDVVRVKETVTLTPWFEDDPIEIQAGWGGTIVTQADAETPCIEFTNYREIPILVDLDAGNLEVVETVK